MKLRKRAVKGIISSRLIVKNAPSWFRENVLTAFTFPNPAYEQAFRFTPYGKVSEKIPKTICLAEEDNNGNLLIPRGIDPHQCLMDRSECLFNEIEWRDKRSEAPVYFPVRCIALNQAQKKLVGAYKRVLKHNKRPFGNTLLVAPTSAGKTITQAVCSELTGHRTLVLCATNLIRDAWVKDLKLLYGLKKEEIGIIQQAKWKIGEHFTLASVATICQRKHQWKQIAENFGTVVLDESQKVSEPRIYRFLTSVPFRYVISASATPKSDTNFYVPAVFGSPIKRLIAQHQDTESSMALRGADVTKTDFRYDYDPQNLDYEDLMMELSANDDRNKLICDKAVEDYEAGNAVLIAVNRRRHLWLLYEMLQERGIEDTNLIYGGTNLKHRRTSNLVDQVMKGNVRMIVATMQAIKLGANLNPLNRLHVAVPAKRDDLEQLIGRIRRRAKFKKDTRIHYYLDPKVRYLFNIYKNHFIPTMRKMRVKGYEDFFLA